MNILFSLLIFSLPLGVLSRINIYGNVYIYLHDIFALLIFILFLKYIIFDKRKINQPGLFKAFVIFVLVAIFSLSYNIPNYSLFEILTASGYLFRFIVYTSIIFASGFLESKYLNDNFRKLFISGWIFLLLGIGQFFFYPDLRNLFYLGWDEHLNRLFSTFLDPNFAAVLIVFVATLSAGLFLYSKKKFLYGFVFISSVICLLLTYSRTGLIAFVVSMFVFLFLMKQAKIFIPIVLFIFILYLLFSNFQIEGLNPLRVTSIEARITSAKTAVEIIAKNPLFGVGFNAYRYAQLNYGFRSAQFTNLNNADAGVENSFLFVLATCGIIGFAAFVNFMVQIFKFVPRKIEKGNEVLSAVAFPSLAAWVVSSLFINTLFYTVIVAWIYIVIGVMVNRKR